MDRPYRRSGRIAAAFAGLNALIIGIVHFALPGYGYRAADLAEIPLLQREHFVYLGTYAIGSFLIAFGVMTLRFARGPASGDAALFFGLMSGVWALRTVLELLYPVALPLFVVATPHPALLTTTALVTLAYLWAFAAVMRARS